MILRHIDTIDTMITELDIRIGTEIEPYREDVELLDTVPGIGQRAAEVILAEIGADMNRFDTAAHLASWAGMCPSNNKTAGKAKPGHVNSRTPYCEPDAFYTNHERPDRQRRRAIAQLEQLGYTVTIEPANA